MEVKCVGYRKSLRETGIDILEHLDDLVVIAEKKHAPILTRDTLYLGDNRVDHRSLIRIALIYRAASAGIIRRPHR